MKNRSAVRMRIRIPAVAAICVPVLFGFGLSPGAAPPAKPVPAAAVSSPVSPTLPVSHTLPLAGRLAAPPVLSGSFAQEKIIVGLKKPLLSRGDFLVARDKGVIWRTLKPFAAAVAVTQKGIWSLKQNGAGLTRQAIHQGNLGLAMDMIQKVLAGDPAALDKVFTVAEKGDSAAWTLDLKPLDPIVARVILSIRLQGGRRVDRVEYAEANGDKTRIEFSAAADNGGALASWQAVAFRD